MPLNPFHSSYSIPVRRWGSKEQRGLSESDRLLLLLSPNFEGNGMQTLELQSVTSVANSHFSTSSTYILADFMLGNYSDIPKLHVPIIFFYDK